MPTEPASSLGFRLPPKANAALAVSRERHIALAQNVHPDQCVKLKRVGQLDANDLIEYEWKSIFSIRPEAEAKRKPFDLTFALCRLEWALAKANQTDALR